MIDFRFFFFLTVVVIKSLSHVWLFETPCTATCQTPCPSLSPEFAQTHVHCVDNAIQPSHPLLVPSPAFNLSQHQGLWWPVLELQLRHQSFQWIVRVDFLEDWPVWSPCSPRDSQESSPAPEFESMDSFLLYVFNAVNVPVSNEFTVLYKLW